VETFEGAGSMSGPNVFGVARSVWNHPILKGRKPFSRREAWMWMVSEAAWKQRKVRPAGHTITLERGQIAHSIRFMAEAWRWEQTKVVRFFNDLKTETMIATETATGITVTTICNYDKYQVVGLPPATAYATLNATETQQERNTTATNEKQVNRETIEDNTAGTVSSIIFFEVGVIRLTKKNFDQWKDAFSYLDLKSELIALSEWAGKQPKWFPAVAGALNKKNGLAKIATEREKKQPYKWNGIEGVV
jgi:hypothetical protein